MNIVIKVLAVTIISILFTKNINAQVDSLPKRAKSIYVEVLRLKGAGTLFTGNFDIRFSKKQNGLGVHAGVGVIKSLIGGNTFYIPVGINALVGKKAPHYFEAGVNLLGIIYSKYYNNQTKIALLPSIGYRYQPLYNALTFRAFVAPYISFNRNVYLTAGLSAGYKF